MNDKLQKKIAQAEDEIAGEIVEARSEAHREKAKMQAMYVLGGINVVNKVAVALSSESIKTLQRFQEEKMHEELGHPTFVHFLENSEFSPMTKAQFYERKALLEKEGDVLFDLLTESGMSIRKRKLLGKGNVELSGEIVIVHDGDEVTEISIHDRSSIFAAITALADANAEKAIKLERQKEKIEKHDGEKRELYDEIDKVRAAKIAEGASNPHMVARVELGIAFRKLTEAATNLSAIEKEQFRDGVLEDVAMWRTDLAGSYATASNATYKPVEVKGKDLAEALDNFLDNVDLDAVADNDGDLAAQL